MVRGVPINKGYIALILLSGKESNLTQPMNTISVFFLTTLRLMERPLSLTQPCREKWGGSQVLPSFSTYIIPKLAQFVKSFLRLFALYHIIKFSSCLSVSCSFRIGLLRRGFRETPANHTMRLTWTCGSTVFVIRARTVMSWVSESHVLGHSHFKGEEKSLPHSYL